MSRPITTRAFTLVELLVVVAIIAVLISILLPALNKAQAVAKQTKCLSNMRQVVMATQFYANDNNGMTPIRGTSINGSAVAVWPFELWPYAKPGSSVPHVKTYKPQQIWYPTIFNCPERTLVDTVPNWDLGLIYSFNTWLKSSRDPTSSIKQTLNAAARLSGIQRSDVFLYVEQASKDVNNNYQWSYLTNNPLDHVYHGTILPNTHNGNTNAAFVDGHAKYMQPDDWPRDADGTFVKEEWNARWNGG